MRIRWRRCGLSLLYSERMAGSHFNPNDADKGAQNEAMASPAAAAAGSAGLLNEKEPGTGGRLPAFQRNQMWKYFGPAFVASIAYIDPGNFATNIQGGSRF